MVAPKALLGYCPSQYLGRRGFSAPSGREIRFLAAQARHKVYATPLGLSSGNYHIQNSNTRSLSSYNVGRLSTWGSHGDPLRRDALLVKWHTRVGTVASRRSFVADKAEVPTIAPQILSFSWFSVLWDIALGLRRLLGTIWGLLTGKKSIIVDFEKDVDKVAEIVKDTAKGAEKKAEEIQKVAEIVAEDADKVEAMIDQMEKTPDILKEDVKKVADDVKGSTDTLKGAADELKGSANTLKGTMEDGKGSPKSSDAPSEKPSGTSTSSTPQPTDHTSEFSSGHLQSGIIWLMFAPFEDHAGRWVLTLMVALLVWLQLRHDVGTQISKQLLRNLVPLPLSILQAQ